MNYNNHNVEGNLNPFHSFWMAGFECADMLNAFGLRVDLLSSTKHIELIHQDYDGLKQFGIRTVREGIRWSQVEKSPYHYNWDTVRMMIDCARQHKIQILWDLCHFGFPDDMTPLHPMFARRFATMCTAFVQFYRSVDPDGTLIVTPINEVSFLSWLGGDVRGTSPYCKGMGWEVKYHLMKAYIEGIEAMMEVDSQIRIMPTEPLINVVPPRNATSELIDKALMVHEEQYQVLDILSGTMCPELRGKPEYLDIIGYNYYPTNQWAVDSLEIIDWSPDNNDERWISFEQLLKNAYTRYSRPIVISETSHTNESRAHWMEYIINDCIKVINSGLPVLGICWYPIVDRPDWDRQDDWHQSGLWNSPSSPVQPREICLDTASTLNKCQARFDHLILQKKSEHSF